MLRLLSKCIKWHNHGGVADFHVLLRQRRLRIAPWGKWHAIEGSCKHPPLTITYKLCKAMQKWFTLNSRVCMGNVMCVLPVILDNCSPLQQVPRCKGLFEADIQFFSPYFGALVYHAKTHQRASWIHPPNPKGNWPFSILWSFIVISTPHTFVNLSCKIDRIEFKFMLQDKNSHLCP